MDIALTPVSEGELDELEMFHATDAAVAVVNKLKHKKQQKPAAQPAANIP